MATDVIGTLLAELDDLVTTQSSNAPYALDGDLPASPSGRRGRRSLQTHDRIPRIVTPVSLPEGQAIMEQAAFDYLATEQPTHALLIKAQAGTGKTYIGVKLALHAASQGLRVLYIGPRHDFWNDVIAETVKQGGDPAWWYHWFPRQRGDDESGKVETCRHEPYINTWLHRGYDALEFCQRVCGWQYIANHCPYHAQKTQAERVPIIFCQHQHLTAGHPLMRGAQIIIGDESPLAAFPDNWCIPLRWIVPDGMPYDEPLTELLYKLQAIAVQSETSTTPIMGVDLLARLGGVDAVREACSLLDLPDTYDRVIPWLHHPSEADNAPFWHLPDLTRLLLRECDAADDGRSSIPRVRIVKGKLHLLRRARINDHASRHIVWLDATANEHLYRTVFERPIEVIDPPIALRGTVYQVYDRLNNRSKLIKPDGAVNGDHLAQLKRQLSAIIERHGYKRPLVISHMPLAPYFQEYEFGHFGGERGTNRYEGCDAAFIIGVQQPSTDELQTIAAMIYDERDQPFRAEWLERDLPFVNHPYSFLVSGFWADPDLHALLWQTREAEIIQAAHRVRPVRHAVDVWLLNNIPIDDLPADHLVSLAEVFDAPDGVDPYAWHEFMDIVTMAYEDNEPLTPYAVAELLGCTDRLARKYLRILTDVYPDRWNDVYIPSKGGRPIKAAAPQK